MQEHQDSNHTHHPYLTLRRTEVEQILSAVMYAGSYLCSVPDAMARLNPALDRLREALTEYKPTVQSPRLELWDYLSVRTANALAAGGVSTIEDLSARSERELLRFDCIGKRSIVEINEALSELGMSLRAS